MKFISNRDKNISEPLSNAIQLGLAGDGGLFIPEYFPKIDISQFSQDLDYSAFAYKLLYTFFIDDQLSLKLENICKSAFSFPVLLNELDRDTFILDLCQGPTLSFKDFGARFLAECLNNIPNKNKVTIMVATSGDTGSAVASAFYDKNNTNVIILFPKGKISNIQEKQITCWDKNILAIAIDGTFDDCQRLVKEAFQSPWWKNTMGISSANSINIGRLLPQIVYYAYTSLQFFYKFQSEANFIIPTGNLGNATAAYWAKEMGFPINEIAISTNENKVITDYIDSGVFFPRKSKLTLANAMDVGNPSNFERLISLFKSFEVFKNNVTAISVDDQSIKATIKEVYDAYKTVICPHTATAFFVKKILPKKPWIVVSTADPCKFENIVEPLISKKIPQSPQLQNMLNRHCSASYSIPLLSEIEKVVMHKFI